MKIQYANFPSPGMQMEDLIGRHLYTFAGPDRQQEIKEIQESVLHTGKPASYETDFQGPRSKIYYESRVVPHRIPGSDEIKGLMLTAREITQRKLAEQRLRDSISEKEVLLQEIHHRVKNNLQIVISLFRLQSAQIENKKALEIIKSGQNRVMSMSLVHEKLYKSQDFSRIDFGQYLKDLSAHLFDTYNVRAGRIRLLFNIKAVLVNINQAIPLGLLVNELITNALIHAFPEGKTGRVRISLKPNKKGEKVLTISDNGVGLPPGFDIANTETLGMVMVNDLVRQIDAKLLIRRAQGTAFSVIF